MFHHRVQDIHGGRLVFLSDFKLSIKSNVVLTGFVWLRFVIGLEKSPTILHKHAQSRTFRCKQSKTNHDLVTSDFPAWLGLPHCTLSSHWLFVICTFSLIGCQLLKYLVHNTSIKCAVPSYWISFKHVKQWASSICDGNSINTALFAVVFFPFKMGETNSEIISFLRQFLERRVPLFLIKDFFRFFSSKWKRWVISSTER